MLNDNFHLSLKKLQPLLEYVTQVMEGGQSDQKPSLNLSKSLESLPVRSKSFLPLSVPSQTHLPI